MLPEVSALESVVHSAHVVLAPIRLRGSFLDRFGIASSSHKMSMAKSVRHGEVKQENLSIYSDTGGKGQGRVRPCLLPMSLYFASVLYFISLMARVLST